MSDVLTESGGSVAAVAAGQVLARSVADCDRALVLLRVLARQGSVEERLLARRSTDRVLDRRNVLVGV